MLAKIRSPLQPSRDNSGNDNDVYKEMKDDLLYKINSFF